MYAWCVVDFKPLHRAKSFVLYSVIFAEHVRAKFPIDDNFAFFLDAFFLYYYFILFVCHTYCDPLFVSPDLIRQLHVAHSLPYYTANSIHWTNFTNPSRCLCLPYFLFCSRSLFMFTSHTHNVNVRSPRVPSSYSSRRVHESNSRCEKRITFLPSFNCIRSWHTNSNEWGIVLRTSFDLKFGRSRFFIFLIRFNMPKFMPVAVLVWILFVYPWCVRVFTQRMVWMACHSLDGRTHPGTFMNYAVVVSNWGWRVHCARSAGKILL